jgi:cytochrome c biogenesis protein
VATTAAAGTRGRPDFDVFRLLWRLLTSVRFALFLIALLAGAAFLGVLIPQVPSQMRGNPAAVDAWVEFQRDKFGVLTDVMYSAELFTIFQSFWFAAILAVLVASVCVCTANRLPPVWRNVRQPQGRVPDEYFGAGPQRDLTAANTDGLVDSLRRRRYKVSTWQENGATYLFADRFPWAQLATFVSHLALILFLAGGLVTLFGADEGQVLVAEGESAPIFGVTDPKQMQVYVEDAVGRFDDSGFPLDFRTFLVVYQGGKEVARGVSTVNDPLTWDGFKFHQSAYFGDGAALRVRDVATGRVVYSDVLALEGATSAPRIVVRDAGGAVLLNDLIVPTDFLEDATGTIVRVPGTEREFWIGARAAEGDEAWQLIVFETGGAGARSVLGEQEVADLGGGLSLSFVGVGAVPSTIVTGLPGTTGNEAAAALSDGPTGKLLTVGPVQGRAVALAENEPVVLDGLEYTFLGGREFSGITVRRDPGGTFIWIATGLLLLGLALTFYLPRRRLWGKIHAGKASFRGLGGRTAAIDKEIDQVIARANGASDSRAPE